MKRIILHKYLILILLFITGTASVWGQTEITFDIAKGSVTFTDDTYTGVKIGETTATTGTHNANNKYIITGKTTTNYILVGNTNASVTEDFLIYLNDVDIRRSSKDGKDVCACAVYNKNQSVVAIILKDGTKNILYSGYNRAGLEKSGGASADGTLLITCEDGYVEWLKDNTHGHTTGTEFNISACDDNCGHLDARSGNAWETVGPNTYYHAGAGIGTSGEGTGGSSSSDVNAGNNALINLTIAGGHITAAGTWGTTGGSSGGAASIGTGCAVGTEKIAGTVSGLKITGGNIIAYRMDNSAACIGGGYRSGYVTMDIYGGTITADNLDLNGKNVTKMRAAAIGGGGGGAGSASPAGATVRIHNGKITASGHYGSAIGSGAGGSSGHGQNAEIIINNGDITAITSKGEGNNGSGAAIGAGGSLGSGHAGKATITINGGRIVATSELGADIGGGGTNSSSTGDSGGEGIITITGGDITANNGGIGGGRANKGVGGNAEITISGENTTITAKSIGGGRSKTNIGGNVKLTVNGGTLTVNDYIGGGIGGAQSDQIGWAKVYIKGGTISGRTVMKASATDGCVFDMSGGTVTSPISDQPGGAVYMVDSKGTATLSGGTIQNCQGTTGGAVYMTGGIFTISGNGTMSNNKATQNGAALYLAGTGKVFVNGGNITGSSEVNKEAIYMAGGEFTMTAGTIKDFKGSKSGAVFMQDGTFSMTNGLIDNCSGTENGAIYMSGGTFGISGGTISNCAGAQNGGAVYLAGTGTLNINGGTIKGNSATSDGGAIYLTDGTFNMTAGKVEANTSQGGNGAGIYINNGTVSLTGGEVAGNDAMTGKGGGFYVAGGNVTLSNGTISSNKAKTAGGGICLEGASSTSIVSMNVNGCTLTENEATEGNGGGIFLSNAEMTYNGGLLTLNKASYNQTADFTTGYRADAGSVKGIGGGIYISGNSKLTFGDFSSLGVYANTADVSADDLFANGNNTSLLLPNIEEMSLLGYAGNADGLGWYEDYFTGDTSYNITNIAKGNTQLTSFENRFRVAQGRGATFMRLYELNKDEVSRELTDCYVSLALGFLFSDLTIRVQGLRPGESCIFNVTGQQTNRSYLIPVYGTQNQSDEQKIVKLPVDTYTVTLMDSWTWAYDIPADKKIITKLNSQDGGIYLFDVEHIEDPITHDEQRVSIKLE